jgi:hypothetical protein
MPVPSICQATCGGIATQFAEQAHPNPKPGAWINHKMLMAWVTIQLQHMSTIAAGLATISLAYSMRLVLYKEASSANHLMDVRQSSQPGQQTLVNLPVQLCSKATKGGPIDLAVDRTLTRSAVGKTALRELRSVATVACGLESVLASGCHDLLSIDASRVKPRPRIKLNAPLQ